ncbi:MAG: leucine-rich repeat domain-containing protein [Bacteroidia bacterium]|nr:leucine-rich repeat domain-containing protein [Bacteroidia bacterium]
MTSKRLLFLAFCIGSFGLSKVYSQIPDTTTISEYKQQVRQLVSFLEYTFNAIGDSSASAREKEIIINQSYLKIFRDAEVQIEDDLAEYRSTVTNKNVQAYLKDIDFFFHDVSFEFNINEVSHELNEGGELYFQVSLDRVLRGITVEKDTLYHVQPRIIEINLEPDSRVLKIASIYTTRLSEEEDLANWWNELSFDWRVFFAEDISLTDSLSMPELLAVHDTAQIGDTLIMPSGEKIFVNTPLLFADLRRIMQKEKLDLSYNPSVTDLEPLSKLTRLKEINISGTIIRDLTPIRNLTRLEVLKCENTRVSDFSPMKYAVNIREIFAGNTRLTLLEPLAYFPLLTRLDIQSTMVTNLQPLANLTHLKEIYLKKTFISSLAPLSGLSALEIVDFSETQVSDLGPLRGKKNLHTLYIEHTPVTNISPLSDALSLRLIFADSSRISSLEPLDALTGIRKIYCDQTLVSRESASRFMRKHPGSLVIYASATLHEWWEKLPDDWKNVFAAIVEVSEVPSREELHQVAGISRIDINSHPTIKNLEPLSMLTNLEELYCAYVPIDTLGPIADLVQLQILDCSHTRISNISSLRYLNRLTDLNCAHTLLDSLNDLSELFNLEWLDLEKTQVADLSPLDGLTKLREVYCDSTGVNITEVRRFLANRADCLVIFESGRLESWWENLSEEWQRVIRNHIRLDPIPDREQLHQIISLEGISIVDNQRITDLEPLSSFLRLSQLKITNTAVTNLDPIAKITSLKVIDCSLNPLQNLAAISELKNLTYLNVENTPIQSLEPLVALLKLEELICAGTQIKDLKALSSLYNLKRLDCSNTDIRKLTELDNLPGISVIKCFNTRLTDRKVEEFRINHTNCEVVFY